MMDQFQILYIQNSKLENTVEIDPKLFILGFLKNNKVCYNALKFKDIFPKDGIGAPTNHKENIYKKVEHRNKKVGGC
jgi:hypothetical protein